MICPNCGSEMGSTSCDCSYTNIVSPYGSSIKRNHPIESTMKELNSLKEIADYLRLKAEEIGDTYLIEVLKLMQAADILDPPDKNN